MSQLHDGYMVDTLVPTLAVHKYFYPTSWLARVGYYNAMPYPCDAACLAEHEQKALYGELVAAAAGSVTTTAAGLTGGAWTAGEGASVLGVLMTLSAAVLFGAGVAIGALAGRRRKMIVTKEAVSPEEDRSFSYYRMGAPM